MKLQEGHPVDENLRPIKVGGESTALETANHGNGARVNGDLEVTGNIKGNVKDVELDLSQINSTDLTIDDSGSISLDATSSNSSTGLLLKNAGTLIGDVTVHHSGTYLTLYENGGASVNAYITISSGVHGASTISTTDAAGTNADLTLDVDGDITLDSETGVFIAKKGGTEFSAAGSAYAGMILGYTRIANDGTGASDSFITMDGTLTVLQTVAGTDLSITFKAPPSGNVEITMDCAVYASSKTVEFALSDNATYNEINETHTYDAGVQSSDETDQNMTTVRWAVTGLTAGTSYTYYIAGAETVSGTTNIRHGRFRTSGTHYPPIIIKAVALPATIVTGG